ncbi:helix-turn-helix transcriptional regulator [Nocardioides terrigena]|uniref:helix-turn-helix transcriptional regulator n=1 Tax=Nocardioides terrigena TaxID=424797 RepID=UPI001F3F16AA|nr:helix-turn-helix domain-containing protein [Nocardioides terrigena]
MENNQRSRAGLGPRPATPRRPLSLSRSAILEHLRAQPEPVTQAALVTITGLHGNTVREHLDALVRSGLARRVRAEPNGRGRPAWLYDAISEESTSEYAGLAAALAASIARTSRHPGEDAAAAGEAWGHELARDRAGAAPDPAAARGAVLDLLEDLGFDPHQDAEDPSRVRLARCPLLAAAHRHPEVVCGVHLGLVRGALEEYGADPAGSDLVPFAAPGACLLVVPPLDEAP